MRLCLEYEIKDPLSVTHHKMLINNYLYWLGKMNKMDVQGIKLELIEMLLRTEEEIVLQKIKEILEHSSLQNFFLTEEDYKIIDQRRENHLSGKSKSFSWEEAKEAARSSVK